MDGRTVSVNPHSRAYTLDYLHSPSCLLYSETVGRRYRIGSAITLACLPSILLILEGCSSTPPPSGVHFPITNGSHTLLPSTQQRILIWGDPLLARVADEWLRSHHYSNILMPPQIPYPPIRSPGSACGRGRGECRICAHPGTGRTKRPAGRRSLPALRRT